ncbi:YqgE/AlgH family protein, partial [Vibrio parahaemolyticus]
INKPISLTLGSLFEKVELSPPADGLAESPVFYGGPVQTDRGFVLHEPLDGEGPHYNATLAVPGGLEMTTSRDVLEALSNG